MSYTLNDLRYILNVILFPESKIGDHIVNERRDGKIIGGFNNGSLVEWNGVGINRHFDGSDVTWLDDIHRLIHYEDIYTRLELRNAQLRAEGDEGTTSLNKECTLVCKRFYKKSRKPKPKLLGLSFYTIMPRNRIGISEGEVAKMAGFAKKFFTEKYFEKCWWILESGKHKDKPNLHIHLLCRFAKHPTAVTKAGVPVSMSKSFVRNMKTAWNHIYDQQYDIGYDINGNRGVDCKACNTAEIQKDKLAYMCNDQKGTHENFVDLKVKGGF